MMLAYIVTNCITSTVKLPVSSDLKKRLDRASLFSVFKIQNILGCNARSSIFFEISAYFTQISSCYIAYTKKFSQFYRSLLCGISIENKNIMLANLML